MPKGPLPTELQEFLRRPNPCVVATIRPDGELHTAATWYEWQDDGTVLLNMDASRRRLAHMRGDPRVALTVLDESNWYSHVSLIGRVREIRPDPGLVDIDRLSQRYRSAPYRDRNRDSWTAIVEVHRWHVWGSLRD
ncbi:MAG TPA: PPOX class F420-dependent oxidoreductase [Gaiellaceae bacterium]|jgi:PPOX class probable F420-dependent enzyme